MRAHSIVFHSNAEASLPVDLSTRLAILEPVVELISRLPQCSTITGSWMRSRGIDLSLTGRLGAGVGAVVEVAAPKSVCTTPHKVLHNPINRLRRDLNLDSTTYNITKIKT